MSTKRMAVILAAMAALGISGCKSAPKKATEPATSATASTTAPVNIKIEPKSGSSVEGALTLSDSAKGLHVVGFLTGLSAGKHGIHIHEKGDCSAADASSAGPHFAIDAQKHGAPGKPGSHSGDLGNIKANKKGEASIDQTFHGVTLAEVMGRSVVVHAKADDFKTQPSGASGDKVGCGEIK